jgi:uncharacterized repeat protein (TIGR01451 family)
MLRSFAVIGLDQGLVGALGRQAAVLPVGSDEVHRAVTVSVWRRFRLDLMRTLAWVALALGVSAACATTSINHQFSPSVINQGDNSLYTITITNDSTTPLTDAKATIFLDNTVGAPNTSGSNVKIANGTVLSNTCGFTGVTAAADDNKIILTGGTVARWQRAPWAPPLSALSHLQ